MTGKIEASINAKADDIRAAGAEGHHLVLGPGPVLEAEWTGAGLELPNVEAMRDYRIARVRRQLDEMGYDGAILWEPANIRYCTDSTNMQVWTSRNPSRYCWVGADESVIMCEFF